MFAFSLQPDLAPTACVIFPLGNKMTRSHDLISTGEAALSLKCTVQHVRALLRRGRVTGQKLGRDWFIDRVSLESHLAARYAEPVRAKPLEVHEPQRGLFDDPRLQPVVNVASVPQRSPFRYPGGKTWLVPVARLWLASLERKPDILVEPFAGGGGIGLMAAFEDRVKKSLLVEIDPDVAAVWRVILSSEAPSLQKLVRAFECNDAKVREALALSPQSDLERAFQTILRNRVSRGGILAPGAGLVKQGEANKGIASRWYPETLATRIGAIREQRSRLSFREGDGLEVLCEHASNVRASYFVDPPYPVAGRRLYTCYKMDHRDLFSRLASLRGPFLATYDHNDQIRDLAEEFGFAWTLIPMKSTHHTKKYELIISRDLGWLASEEAVVASVDAP